jgi:hypothetical protein
MIESRTEIIRMKRIVLFIMTTAVAVASGPGLDSAIAMNSSTAAGQMRPLNVLVLLGEWFGDGFESAPIKEICDAVARELAAKEKKRP